jgi:hypothetical protein
MRTTPPVIRSRSSKTLHRRDKRTVSAANSTQVAAFVLPQPVNVAQRKFEPGGFAEILTIATSKSAGKPRAAPTTLAGTRASSSRQNPTPKIAR